MDIQFGGGFGVIVLAGVVLYGVYQIASLFVGTCS